MAIPAALASDHASFRRVKSLARSVSNVDEAAMKLVMSPLPPSEDRKLDNVLSKYTHGIWAPRRVILSSEKISVSREEGCEELECIFLSELVTVQMVTFRARVYGHFFFGIISSN